MVEVTTRVSKSAVLSDVNSNTSRNFDVRSWRGLTSLLTAGRKSSMNAEAYADFRDTVLSYAQSGGTDVELRKKLEQIIKSFDMKVDGSSPVISAAPARDDVPVQVTVNSVPSKASVSDTPTISRIDVGSARPVPAFGATVAKKSEEVTKVVSVQDISFIPHNLPVHTDTDVVIDVSPSELFKSKPENLVTKVKEASIPTPKSDDTIPVIPQVKTLEEYKARIAEIKRTVNAEVGNPVMLVDAHNEIGREYMTALLNAMKATSGGAPGTLVTAMETLENSFRKIVTTVQKKSEEIPVPQTAPVEIPAVATEAVVVPEKPVASAPTVPQSVSNFAIPSLQEQVQKDSVVVSDEKASIDIYDAGANTTPAIDPEVSKHSVKGVGLAHLDVTLPGDEKQLVPDEVKELADTPEINEGLAQLVNEWSIFRGGGLFGTGPNGVEHPLFKKLRMLDMASVVGGRFEGASKEIVLSINDYTNGWRHEQGIAHLPNETFEQYLRRVVKRILKRRTSGG